MSSIYMTPKLLIKEEEVLIADEPKYLFYELKPCRHCKVKPELKWHFFSTPCFYYAYYECPVCKAVHTPLATSKKAAKYRWNEMNRIRRRRDGDK